MPVVEVKVRPGSSVGPEHRYGCFNRPPYRETVESSHGDTWPYRMSNECRYDRSLSDRFCSGCKHAGSGEHYIAEQNDKGAK